MHIGIHVITPTQPGNPNRDDLGNPKIVTVGGVQRARYSPQAREAAIRPELAALVAEDRGGSILTTQTEQLVKDHIVEQRPDVTDEEVAVFLDALDTMTASKKNAEALRKLTSVENRTRDAEDELTSVREEAEKANPGKSPEQIAKLKPVVTAQKALDRAIKAEESAKDSADNGGALWRLTPKQIANVAETLLSADPAEVTDMAKATKVDKKKHARLYTGLLDAIMREPSLDTAAFGRLFTAPTMLDATVDAAVQVAHSFSVNEYVADVDYFTGIDQVEDQAAIIGYNYLSAPVMYSYSAVDVSLLARQFQVDPTGELFTSSLTHLVQLLATVMPRGRITKSGTVSDPSSVYLTAGASCGTLSSAFTRPTDDDAEALRAMLIRSGKLTKGMGRTHDVEALWTVHDEVVDEIAGDLTAHVHDTLSDAVEAVVSASVRN